MHFRLVLASLIVYICVMSSDAQRNLRPDRFNTWVYQLDGQIVEKQFLRAIGTDSLLVSTELLPPWETGFRRIDISDISSVRVRNRSKQAWGALIGFVAGATAGALIGKGIEGGDFCGGSCGGTAPGTLIALSATSGAMIGVAVGVGVGSGKKKFRLNGRITEDQLVQLQRYQNSWE